MIKKETKLIDELTKTSNLFECKVLDVGDIHICDNSNNIMLIFERKTIADLLSSIKDGRYSEQSLRLTHIGSAITILLDRVQLQNIRTKN